MVSVAVSSVARKIVFSGIDGAADLIDSFNKEVIQQEETVEA
jgi:hypothetical protein